jgi:uncharacterized protein (DUF697 family)
MTRKKLPKAITRTSEDLREITAGAVADEEAPAPRSALLHDAVEANGTPAVSLLPAAGHLLPAASIHAEPQAVRRWLRARKIVERHKAYAALGGLFPLPIVNIAGVTAIIMRMVKQMSDLYEVPFERDRTRSIIIGFMGGAVPTGLGAATASTLALAIPGSALVGLAVSSITAAALTRGIGLVFVEHFENGGMLPGVTEVKHA